MKTLTPSATARLHGIYVIINEGPGAVELAHAALRGGVQLLQYRAKAGINLGNAMALRILTREHGALLIINDDWQAAIDLDADGAHLGPEDCTDAQLSTVRRQVGDKLLGLSCGTTAEAKRAQEIGADYIGVGSVFATGSKADAGAPIGVDGLKSIAASVEVPVAAIGGITLDNLAQVRESGVAMAALISAFAQNADPQNAARQLVEAWRR